MGRNWNAGSALHRDIVLNVTCHISPQSNLSYKKRTLEDALKYGYTYQDELSKKEISESQKKALRKKFKNHISPPYSTEIKFENILIPEFHTWLNKAKRLDNRFFELAKKIRRGLKIISCGN